jgi:hypothetical protein
MVEPKDLSISDLKKMHKGVREKIDSVKDVPAGNANIYAFLQPNYNPIKAEGLMVLRMLDEEFDRRGYDPTKLFKNYQYSNYLTAV